MVADQSRHHHPGRCRGLAPGILASLSMSSRNWESNFLNSFELKWDKAPRTSAKSSRIPWSEPHFSGTLITSFCRTPPVRPRKSVTWPRALKNSNLSPASTPKLMKFTCTILVSPDFSTLHRKPLKSDHSSKWQILSFPLCVSFNKLVSIFFLKLTIM
jgi:hypothetical protein